VGRHLPGNLELTSQLLEQDLGGFAELAAAAARAAFADRRIR
jgi:hypothetical protein